MVLVSLAEKRAILGETNKALHKKSPSQPLRRKR